MIPPSMRRNNGATSANSTAAAPSAMRVKFLLELVALSGIIVSKNGVALPPYRYQVRGVDLAFVDFLNIDSADLNTASMEL